MSKSAYNHSLQDRLLQIEESISIIIERCIDIHSPEDFLLTSGNVMIFDSCVMRLQSIGEQVGKILKIENNPLLSFPEIPWKAIYGMRNFISHEYANIDETVIYSTIREDLPAVLSAISSMLKDFE